MNSKLIPAILSVVMLAIILFNGYHASDVEIENIGKQQIKGTIYRMYKADGNKNYTIVFSDSSEYDLPYFTPTDIIEPGDSIFKDSNSFDYKFFIRSYKPERPADTIIFRGMVDGKYIP